jgi:hypothetical protein
MTLPLRNREDDREDDKGERSPIAETDSSRSPKRDSKPESGQEGLKLIPSDPNTDPSGGEVGELANSTGGAVEVTPLFPSNELRELQSRWDQIQTGFVDQPRNAVNEADALVSSAMRRLTELFTAERSQLEKQWDSGDSVSTENLRIAFQRYRSFFRRVLAV